MISVHFHSFQIKQCREARIEITNNSGVYNLHIALELKLGSLPEQVQKPIASTINGE